VCAGKRESFFIPAAALELLFAFEVGSYLLTAAFVDTIKSECGVRW